MVPYALNQKVEFLKNYGPKLENFDLESFLKNDDLKFTEKLKPVYKAIEITRRQTAEEVNRIICIIENLFA